VDLLGGDRDQCAGGQGGRVHEGDGAHVAGQQGPPDLEGGVEPATGGVDGQDHRGGPVRLRVVEDAFQEGGQSEVDLALDRSDDHRTFALCTGVTEQGERQPEAEHQHDQRPS